MGGRQCKAVEALVDSIVLRGFDPGEVVLEIELLAADVKVMPELRSIVSLNVLNLAVQAGYAAGIESPVRRRSCGLHPGKGDFGIDPDNSLKEAQKENPPSEKLVGGSRNSLQYI